MLAGAALVACAALIPEAARAGEIARACADVDEARRTSCQLEHAHTGEWVLTTGLVVGSGDKASVAALERRFCDVMVARGRSARVTRLSALPGFEDQAAKMEWRCGARRAPAVSSGPPSSMPRYGGAYLR